MPNVGASLSVTHLFLFRDLVDSFFQTMEKTGADFTNSFRCLSGVPLPSSSDFEKRLVDVKDYLLSQCCTAEELKKEYTPRMDPRYGRMTSVSKTLVLPRKVREK